LRKLRLLGLACAVEVEERQVVALTNQKHVLFGDLIVNHAAEISMPIGPRDILSHHFMHVLWRQTIPSYLRRRTCRHLLLSWWSNVWLWINRRKTRNTEMLLCGIL